MTILRGYAEELPFEDSRFDLVTCSNCIDHTDSPTGAIDEIFRVLKPQGWCVLTCEVFAGDKGKRNAGHPHSMTEQKLLDLAGDFELVRHWSSPWYGLRRFALELPPTSQIEHILLLRKPG
jgi:ubiquinone/menaquinone biosynthesis C-methylase UbiE